VLAYQFLLQSKKNYNKTNILLKNQNLSGPWTLWVPPDYATVQGKLRYKCNYGTIMWSSLMFASI